MMPLIQFVCGNYDKYNIEGTRIRISDELVGFIRLLLINGSSYLRGSGRRVQILMLGWGITCGVVANLLDYDILASLNSSRAIAFTFGLTPLEKVWILLPIPTSYMLNSTIAVFQQVVLTLNNPRMLICKNRIEFSLTSPWLVIFTNPSARAGYDTRSIFERSLAGLNSEFSFS